MKTTSTTLEPHNASEVIRSGLRFLEDQQQKKAALRSAIEEGLNSGIVEDFDSRASRYD